MEHHDRRHDGKLRAIADAQAAGLVRQGDPFDVMALVIAVSMAWSRGSSRGGRGGAGVPDRGGTAVRVGLRTVFDGAGVVQGEVGLRVHRATLWTFHHRSRPFSVFRGGMAMRRIRCDVFFATDSSDRTMNCR
ncbi:hypothetical protein GCM10010294_04780 [Streptomyces griseoloalbus]|nr:hypothetical protein GCM10010294_04780 [Streptomyces griseoloalbus]